MQALISTSAYLGRNFYISSRGSILHVLLGIITVNLCGAAVIRQLSGPWLTEGAVAAPGVISTAAVEVSVNVSGVLLEFNQPLSIANGKQSKLATTIRE
jgi:hypothetical protein